MDIATVIAALSLLVSVGAFAVALRATLASERAATAAENSAAAAVEATAVANRPLLRASIEGAKDWAPSRFVFAIENDGNGPAIVLEVSYATAAGKYESGLFPLFSFYGNEMTYHDLEPSFALPKGRTQILSIDVSAMEDRLRYRAYQDVSSLCVKISYRTMTDEKSEVTLRA